ncbi:monocarboxylate transporter 12-like [Ptychodera flava]|uniref:monocarboxylate transporter 12-like n=1 Tax=Ptychodera flava TaxID=63121 RepID=UPI003969FE23
MKCYIFSHKKVTSIRSPKMTSLDPPEGGWGWVIVIAAFTGFLISAGSLNSFGVLYVAFLDAFGESNTATAWINGIFNIFFALSANYGVALSKRFGHRKTVMAAGVLASIGISISAFTTRLNHLFITYGILTGIGLGLTYVVYIEIVSLYFNRRFKVAIGLAMAGTGAGQLFFSIVTQTLVDRYGWRGALIILSGIVSHVCVVGALLRPLRVENYSDKHSKGRRSPKARMAEEHEYRNNNTDEKTTPLRPCELTGSCESRGRKKYAITSTSNGTCPGNFKSCLFAVYDFSLFKNPTFVVLLLIIVGQTSGIVASSVHSVKRARDFGISNIQSAYVPAVMGLAQMIGRPGVGAVGHVTKLHPCVIYALCMFVGGISLIFSVYMRNFTGQIIFIAVFGVSTGGYVIHNPIVVKLLLGRENLGHTISFFNIIIGVWSLLFSPLGGWIRDTSKCYDGYFWLAGAAELIAAVLGAVLPIVDRIGRRGDRKQEPEGCNACADMKTAAESIREAVAIPEDSTAL